MCLVYGDAIAQLLRRLERVLERLSGAGLKVKPKKCRFFKKRVTFLGHQVSAEGVRPDEQKIGVVMKWPEPTTVEALQGFLGLVNYFNRYIPNYALVAAPLYELTRGLKGKTRVQLSEEGLKAFNSLKDA